MSNRIMSLIKEVNDLLDLRLKNLYTFEMLYDEWGEGETNNIGDVSIKSLLRSPTHLRFLTDMPPGSTLPLHWHNCKETILVLSGQIIDRERPAKIYGTDETYVLMPMTKHMIKNNMPHKNTILQIDFSK